ncbi:MAG: polysaccharide deacetylase family protein [Rhizobiales bacterium]|nr:polysaccharide deacetylase family protein [Hyphomicrobiales bacterium]
MLPGHQRYDYSPVTRRADYSWPDNKRLAFYIATNIEVFAFETGIGPDPIGVSDMQTHRNFAWRDYGNRIGVWYLFDLYEELGLPSSCLVNSAVYDQHPDILERVRKRGDDIIGHGRTNAERQRGLWEVDERRLIDDATQTIAKHEGRPPKGWLGGSVTETRVTLDLLKEAGYRYVLDWPCDDQPIWMKTRSGPILSVPYPFELNDIGQVIQRKHSPAQFADMIVDQFDEQVRRSADHPQVCALSLHTFIAGQPFRIPALRKALKHIAQHPKKDRVWFTRADAIADHCYGMPPGIIPGG